MKLMWVPNGYEIDRKLLRVQAKVTSASLDSYEYNSTKENLIDCVAEVKAFLALVSEFEEAENTNIAMEAPNAKI